MSISQENISSLVATGCLAYVTARVEDAQGSLCPEATNQLQFKVEGAGSFRAAANGNVASLELFH